MSDDDNESIDRAKMRAELAEIQRIYDARLGFVQRHDGAPPEHDYRIEVSYLDGAPVVSICCPHSCPVYRFRLGPGHAGVLADLLRAAARKGEADR